MTIRSTVVVLLLSSTVAAQEYPPPECVTTTTTTTRCTGSAAPLAVPPVDVTPPPVYVPPPPVYAPPAYPFIIAPPRGWSVVRDADGRFWQERLRSTPNNALMGAGLGIFIGTWLVTTSIAASHGDAYTAVPIFGAMAGAIGHSFDNNGATLTGLYALSALVQTTGFVLSLVGAGTGPKKKERQPLYLGGTMVPAGAGASLSGSF